MCIYFLQQKKKNNTQDTSSMQAKSSTNKIKKTIELKYKYVSKWEIIKFKILKRKQRQKTKKKKQKKN